MIYFVLFILIGMMLNIASSLILYLYALKNKDSFKTEKEFNEFIMVIFRLSMIPYLLFIVLVRVVGLITYKKLKRKIEEILDFRFKK